MSAQYWERLDGARNLRAATRNRTGIKAPVEQTKGVVMAARNVSADQAFELLVAESMHRNIKLRVVAEEMLAELRTR
jgi:AmiR/NasT family two-component response regulator